MSFTSQQVRDMGHDPVTGAKLSKGFPSGGVGDSHSSSPSATPRQPVSHQAHWPYNEKQLQEQIANWLRLHDIWFFRSRMDKRSTNTVGCPDFLCSVCSVPIAIECKMSGNVLSEEQKQAKLLMQANGWQHWTVYRLEEVIHSLRLIQETHR